MLSIKNNKLIIFLIFILVINIFTFLFLEYSQKINECEKYIYGFNENFNSKEYVENYPYSVKNNNVYYQIDIFPDLNSLFCIGRTLSVESIPPLEKNIATSYKLYDFLNFLLIYTILFIFYLLKKTLNLFVSVMLINIFILNIIFFGEFVFDYQLLGVVLAIYIFKELNVYDPNDSKRKLSYIIFLIVNFHILLFNYDLFSKLSILFIFIYFIFFKKLELNNILYPLFKVLPITYFLLRLISGLFENFRQLWVTLSSGIYEGTPRFADMFYVFTLLNCEQNKCGTIVNAYGPFFNFVDFKNNIHISTYILSSITIVLIIFIINKVYKKSIENNYLIFLLLVSPPLTFAAERMNIDLLIAILSIFSFTLYKNKYRKLGLFILSFLTLLKIYPIFFISALFLFTFLNKSWNQLKIILIFLLLNSTILFHYFFVANTGSEIPRPNGISWTFGLVSHYYSYLSLLKNFELNSLTIYIIFIISSLLIIYFFMRDEINLHNEMFVFVYIMTFFMCAIFFNFDYRVTFMVIPTILLLQNNINNKFILVAILFIITSPSSYLPEFTDLAGISLKFLISLFYIVINHISFYIIFSIIFVSVFRTIKNLLKQYI